ncbi:MAG: OadG family transporter subunit, partial [Anaerolineales bacterium]
MTNDLVLALEISTLGMGLVFAALILLWWMMALLTSLTADKESVSPMGMMSDSAEPVSVMANDDKARVAAIAVAFALAQEETTLA